MRVLVCACQARACVCECSTRLAGKRLASAYSNVTSRHGAVGGVQGLGPDPQGLRLGRGRLRLLVSEHETTQLPLRVLTEQIVHLTPFQNHLSRYAYTGLVTSAKRQTSPSTYVDLLGLTVAAQLGSVFWDGAWLLLLLVRACEEQLDLYTCVSRNTLPPNAFLVTTPDPSGARARSRQLPATSHWTLLRGRRRRGRGRLRRRGR